MATPLRALLVEDSAEDARLILRELARGDFSVTHARVENEDALKATLTEQEWELVLSDWSMPNFSAVDALRVVKSSGRDVPFIIVSGTIGEEVAVEALKAGAHDFFNKQRLTRLVPAVIRELREATIRHEHVCAVERVRASEENLSAIFNQVAVGIVNSDLDGRIRSANARFCQLVGREPETIEGMNMLDVTHDEDRDSSTAELQHIKDGSRAPIAGESRLLRPDGSFVWVNRTATPVTDAQNRVTQMVTVIQDISALKQVEADLKQAVQARDEFISIASHELKTPMTSLELQIESALLLLDRQGEASIERIRSKLSTANRQVDRLTALVNSLLDVTRITSGRYTLARSRVDLLEVVRGVAARFQELLRRSGCELVIAGDGPIPGRWDPVGIETVVNNLLSNAAKFGAGKPIEVSVRMSGRQRHAGGIRPRHRHPRRGTAAHLRAL
jgi:PAS domain S-box-containing protein